MITPRPFQDLLRFYMDSKGMNLIEISTLLNIPFDDLEELFHDEERYFNKLFRLSKRLGYKLTVKFDKI